MIDFFCFDFVFLIKSPSTWCPFVDKSGQYDLSTRRNFFEMTGMDLLLRGAGYEQQGLGSNGDFASIISDRSLVGICWVSRH